MKSLAHFFGASLGLLILAGVHARAEPISWDFSWEPSSLVIAADGGGTGGVSLTLQPPVGAQGNSDIVATNLRTFSSAPVTTPDSIAQGNYGLTLTLTDTESGRSGNMTFTGFLAGTFSTTSSNVANTFTGETTKELELGSNKYRVAIGPYAPPGPPGAANAGTISAHVDVERLPPDGGGGEEDPPPDDEDPDRPTPEPSTLVLSCLGMSFLGAASWRKRRARKTA
jgi:hypothetical protein